MVEGAGDSGGRWTTQTLPLLSPHIGLSVLSGLLEERWDEDSNAENNGSFNDKIKQRSTKNTQKGKNRQAGRGLLDSQT